jgi:3-hydroxyisobutyrate dehydrogenase
VHGFDVMREMLDGHVSDGGRAAASVAEAVRNADAVVTMLPAGRHVREVFTGSGGIFASLGDRKPLLIDSSTIDVATARDVAAAAAQRGLDMLDAPVSGGSAGATAGTLTFMVGGPETAFARAAPLFKAMGRNIVHCGASGAGQAAKICNNMMLGINMIGVAEGIALAQRLGLDLRKLFEVSSTSSGQSWALTKYCPAPGPVPESPANRDYVAGFATALMLKDLSLAQAAAEDTGAPTPLGAQAARIYDRVARDYAAKDFSVVFKWLSEKSREDLT